MLVGHTVRSSGFILVVSARVDLRAFTKVQHHCMFGHSHCARASTSTELYDSRDTDDNTSNKVTSRLYHRSLAHLPLPSPAPCCHPTFLLLPLRGEHSCTSDLLQLPLGQLREELRLHNDRLLRHVTAAQHLEVTLHNNNT